VYVFGICEVAVEGKGVVMPRPKDAKPKHFFSKIVGTSFPNRDGSSRLAEIRQCEILEPLLLVPEANNPADPRAVAVYRAKNRRQIGYMTKRAHGGVFDGIQKGHHYLCYISDLTGSYELPGVNIIVFGAGPTVTDSTLEAYADKMIDELGIVPEVEYNQGPVQIRVRRKTATAPKFVAGCASFFVLLGVIGLFTFLMSDRQPAKPKVTPTPVPRTVTTPSPRPLPAEVDPKPDEADPEPARAVPETLSEGLTYPEVVSIVGSEGRPAGKVGNQARYRFMQRDGKTLETVFENDSLVSWESR